MSDLTRRRLLGTAAAATLAAVQPRLVAAQPDRPAGGCRLCGRAASQFNAPANGLRISDPGKIAIARSTGDAETDHFLGCALLRLASTFEVQPGFAFFDDGDLPNAFATQKSLLPEGQGTVLMGMHLFGQRMSRDKDAGVTVIAICAHEFGHIHQMQAGYDPLLKRLDVTARPVELHADFLAGYYLAVRKRDQPSLDLETVGQIFFSLGDTDFNAPQHHGTPEERIAAIRGGFDFGLGGRATIKDAGAAGLALVARMT